MRNAIFLNENSHAEVEIFFSTASDKMSGIYENPSDIFENSPDKTLLTNVRASHKFQISKD